MSLSSHNRSNTYLHIWVREPVSYSSLPFSSYTSFSVYIQTDHPAFCAPRSSARRRFSEFRWFRRLLCRHHPHRSPPDLPPAGVLVWNKFNAAFLEERRAGLERFLREVVRVSPFLGERALHLFLQTELPIADIELNLEGVRDDSVSEICSYWPATPMGEEGEEEVTTAPRDILPAPRDPAVTLAGSVTSGDASESSDGFWSPPSGSSWLSVRKLSPPGLEAGLIC